MEKKVKDFIGKVVYQGDGLGTYIWSVKEDGSRALIAIIDGYDSIGEIFDNDKEKDDFQDAIGNFIAEAINEKIKRETTYRDLLETCELKEYEGVSVRLLNCIKNGEVFVGNKREPLNVKYITDFSNYTRGQIYSLKNFGRKTQWDLDELMKEYGVKFKGE